jgi:beta-mannosidase
MSEIINSDEVHVMERKVPLVSGWEMASFSVEISSPQLDRVPFIPAIVPGTVASNLGSQNVWNWGDPARFDSEQWCFRCRFSAERRELEEEISIQLEGIATLASVWLNGKLLFESESMFARHEVNVSSLLEETNELLIFCRSLEVALRAHRSRKPAARWRTQVVAESQLRWFRTTLLGRAPGFAPGPEPVGPWRPVTLVRRRDLVLQRRSRMIGTDEKVGVIGLELALRSLHPAARPVSGQLISGERASSFTFEHAGNEHAARATLQIPNVPHWWPHTHGKPELCPLRVELQLAGGSSIVMNEPPVGFRTLNKLAQTADEGGLQIFWNNVPIFCRGVVWTPPDIVSLSQSSSTIRERLLLLRDAGFNMIRVAGTTVYEDHLFHSICDELGLLVWQDMMFANMDYPFADAEFHRLASTEAAAELARLGQHISTAVICGNSEIEQQVGMLGLDPSLGRGIFFAEELPRIAHRFCPGVPYIPSAPYGGDQPFRTNRGVANYFGVGAYLRPLEDARRAEVRFASECLAFANVPEPEIFTSLSVTHRQAITPVSTTWKQTLPRDSGAAWDFEDVRDHYLKLLFAVDPLTLRYSDANRYWELSRMVSGEVMAETFGEWRRPASPCQGAIVLWSADLCPGGGWGILDSTGRPKAAYWFLKRALLPCAIWITDEGLNGLDVHAANDAAESFRGSIRLALYRNGEQKLKELQTPIELMPHESRTFGLEQIFGYFIDASYSYRFGPAAYDLVVTSLHRDLDESPIAQSFFRPLGRNAQRTPIVHLEMSGEAKLLPNGCIEAMVHSRRFAYGVKVSATGFLSNDAYFSIEPTGTRRIQLCPVVAGNVPSRLIIMAVNAEGSLSIPIERPK